MGNSIKFYLRFTSISMVLFLTTLDLYAQNLMVLSTTPVNQELAAFAEGNISLTFNQALDTTSYNPDNFRVFGRWSGPAQGTYSFSQDLHSVTFSPSEKFFAGEWVVVQLSDSIKSSFGEILDGGYYFGFWIETASGSLQQEEVGEIAMRMPGEDWIQVYGAYAGDMNNDAFSDLVVVNEASDDLRILLNDGQGMYPGFTLFDTGNEKRPSPNEGADFNKDGEIDLVVTTAWDNEIRVLFGDGTGSFSTMDVYTVGNGVRGVAVADFNGDGWEDIVATNRLSADMTFLWNEGGGIFTIEEHDVPGMDETACAVTDVNNDGHADVFVAGYNSKNIGVLLNDGNGNFTLSGTKPVSGRPWMITAGDINNDGFADVVAVNSDGNNLVVLFGDGSGGLQEPVNYVPGNFNFPLAVDLGDLDGDGDLDLVASCYQSANYTVFENDGAGFYTVKDVLMAPQAASCAILHDRDNDGDLDISATDEEADVVLLFENPGLPNRTVSLSRTTNVSIEATPNPIGQGELQLKLHLEKAGSVELKFFDCEGKIFHREAPEFYSEGDHRIGLNLGDFNRLGVIFLTVWIDGKMAAWHPLLKP